MCSNYDKTMYNLCKFVPADKALLGCYKYTQQFASHKLGILT